MTGQVVHVRASDSLPLPSRLATLHQVTVTGGAAVDSQSTDRSGRFRLEAAVADSGVTYLVSVRYDGIAYFTDPIVWPSAPSDSVPTLFVYDTSSSEPDIELAERHIVVRAQSEDGSRRVIELLVLANRGTKTRIAADTSQSVWEGAIPAQAGGFEIGSSDVSEEAISMRNDRISIVAPIPPGQRQLLVSYLLPRNIRQVAFPVDQATGLLNVLLGDTGATVTGSALRIRGREELEGNPYVRFQAQQVQAGTPILLQFDPARFEVARLWWVIIPLSAVALASAFAWWWRRIPAEIIADDPETLAAQIAALDATFEGQETEAYRHRRAELKRRLIEALASTQTTE